VRGAAVARVTGVAVVALAGLALAVWFFAAGDDATTRVPEAAVPGAAVAADPRPWAGELRAGNLVVETGDDEALFAAARGLARDVAGAELSSDLLAAGQAIRVVRVEGPTRAPVRAYAHGRVLGVRAVEDPRLREFLEYWLGR
jgi:hypothetical protein